MTNFLTWCVQLTVVVSVAALIPRLLRLRAPGFRLTFWHFVLLFSLVLPWVSPWQHETVILPADAGVGTTGTPLNMAPAAWHFSAWSALLLVLAAGALARLTWLLAGFFRMRQFRLHSKALSPAPNWGTEADIRISEDVQSPVTFGCLNPVILLPAGFPALSEATRDAILCHEIIHIRRKDWLFTLAEELLRTALWFHPAVWWALGEIQLAREQAVDLEAIGMTRSRDQYVDALLTMAGAHPQPDLAPAPLFLRRRHLKQRVISILKEAHMSNKRSLPALAASLVLLSASCWVINTALPLYGAPQIINDGPGVGVETNGAPLMHRNSVPYPAEAAVKRAEGTVTVQVKLDAKGNVADASILSGPEEFRKTVLQSVLNWHFAKSEANSTRQVTISFHLPKELAAPAAVAAVARIPAPFPVAAPSTLKSVSVVNTSEQTRNEITSLVPVHVGDPLTPEALADTAKAVHEYDEHLRLSTRPVSPTETQIVITPPGDPMATLSTTADGPKIRVGGNVQQNNLISQPKPVYPPAAKEARVQGTVRFDATIGPDGTMQNLSLLSGPPLLVQAAMDAVRQWVYKPTLLNGNPVAVITTIDVNFTLSQ